jgi:hypothetical protein
MVLHNQLPHHRDQIYVPENAEIRQHILQLYHSSPLAGHLGQQGMLELVKRTYWWEHMAEYVRDYVKGCHTCSRNKHRNWQTPGVMEPLPVPEGPWEWTQSDHITGLPLSGRYDAIYVIMDRLTKMAHFIPTNTRAMVEDLIQLHL